MTYPIDPITELAATKAIMHFKAAQCDELRAENAKLRELVRGLLWCNGNPWNNGACDDCPISAKGAGRCDRIMRELGIEVDE